MAATLRRGRSGAKAVHGAICSASRKAFESLEIWPPPDEGIHDARKRIKRARAALRLLRDNMGETAYRRENATFRDAARPLSEIRDAKILVDQLDKLARGDRELNGEKTDRLRSALVARRMRARRRMLSSRETLDPVLEALRSARKRLPMPRGRRGWSTLGPSLRRVYRRGRRAAAATGQRATDENLHE